jgi:putative peptide zinc metalloprotease protein
VTVTTTEAGPAQASLHRAAGVELIGEMAGSGYRVPPSLVRRADGQTIQLTPLLYATLHEIDGRRTAAEVAEAASASTGRTVSEDNVQHLVHKLRPLGLLVQADGSEPTVKKQSPLLGLRLRYAVTDPDRTRRLTDPFRFLFRPWMVIPVLAVFAVVCWWVCFRRGLAAAAYDAFERPGLLILVFVVTVLSAGFHEFGHAAAARYGGSTPGVMGFGVYLVWPAFYTDVTDSYRLGRKGRLRVDLGGLYFNAIVAVVITGVWFGVRYDALLLVVATQIIQMIRQLAPLVRFDGYHVLADLTGVPDLYSRIKPTLLSVLPWRWGDPKARLLKPWARVVVTVWVLVVVPLLLGMLAVAILVLPRLLATAWASLGKQQDVLVSAWVGGDMVQATARVLAMIAIIIPVAGIIYMLVRLTRRCAIATWRGTAGKPTQRIVAVVFGALALGGVASAWTDDFRPIQPSERGTIGDILLTPFMTTTTNSAAAESEPSQSVGQAPRLTATQSLVEGQRGVMWALWDKGTPLPTKDSPQLALVLVPKSQPSLGGAGGGVYRTADTAESTIPRTITANQKDQGWVFPFDKPLAPEPGDNQALAVNYRSNTVVYEAAFAFVYATDGADAMNVNEAQAYASCYNCAAVAIAYQVVFVVDTPGADDNDTDPTKDTNDNVAVPQNLAGSLNYMCVNCMTYAYARQLFVTLDEPLSQGAIDQLDALWEKIADYADAIEAGTVPLGEIAPQLEAYTKQIVEIVNADQPGTIPTPTESPTASPTAPSTAAAIDSPTAPPTAAPTESPTVATTASPSLAPAASPTTQAPATESPSPTATVPSPTESSTSSPTTEPPMSFSPTDPATADPSSGTSSTSDPTSEPSGSTSDGSTSGSTSDGSTSGGTAASP